MNLKTILLSAAIASGAVAGAAELAPFSETPEQKAERMQWFGDAKLGIFIH